ncbi:hypothetical protein BDZ94DRAFT_1123542, partial [Collybia nuda]
LEIGSPMASMYILGHPDHYTSHKFTLFWWKRFVTRVKLYWKTCDVNEHGNESQMLEDDETEKVVISKHNEQYVGYSQVDDYTNRSMELENLRLYQWTLRCEKQKLTKDK